MYMSKVRIVYIAWSIFLVAFLLGACMKPYKRPDSVAMPMVQADIEPVEEPVTEIIAVPEPYPLPGQLKSLKEITDIVTIEEEEDNSFNAMTEYDYMPGALYQLYAAPGRLTNISLQPGEMLISAAAGDTVRWVVADTASGGGDNQQVHVLVKPVKPDLHTNIIITTDRRTYHLEAHSFPDSYMASVRWNYPHDMIQLTREKFLQNQQYSQHIIAPHVALEQLDFAYVVSHNKGAFQPMPDWAPLRVFHDGRKTFIQFPNGFQSLEAPVLFVSTHAGNVQLVNYRVKGNFYIVDRVIKKAELRLGTHKPDIIHLQYKGR